MSKHIESELGAQRQERITAILLKRRIVRVNELCKELSASPATIRRDLAEMESRGLTKRVHGGAVCVDNRLDEPVFASKAGIASREKDSIATAALGLIRPSDSIFLDGGSTILALAHLMMEMSSVTVVTNSLIVANLFASKGPRVITVGGELRRLSQTFVGSLSRHTIDNIHVDKAFMGTIGVSATAGMTTTDPREAQTKELIMQHAREVILLADSSKIGKISFVKFGTPGSGQTLLTDSGAPADELRLLKKTGMKVVVV